MPTVRLLPLQERPDWRQAWSAYHDASGGTFFTSLAWIESWISTLPAGSVPWLFECSGVPEVQALGILVRSVDWLGGFVPIRRWWLHATGRPPLDDITIEFNGLVSNGSQGTAERCLFEALDECVRSWDQLMIPHAADPERWIHAAQARGLHVEQSSHACHYVDFSALRASGVSYESALGKKTRYLLRRARKEIETFSGPLHVDLARPGAETEAYFEAMLALHERYWNSRGMRGAFAEPAIRQFHRTLLRSEAGGRACRMYRTGAGHGIVGYLYLFVWHGVAYFYQSGIDYDGIGRSRSPGYVTITEVIKALEGTAVSRFEFLAGDNLYKSRLATGSTALCSLEIHRPTLGNVVLRMGRRIRRSANHDSP